MVILVRGMTRLTDAVSASAGEGKDEKWGSASASSRSSSSASSSSFSSSSSSASSSSLPSGGAPRDLLAVLASGIDGGGGLGRPSGSSTDSKLITRAAKTRAAALIHNLDDLGDDRDDPDFGLLREEGEASDEDDIDTHFFDEVERIAKHVEVQYGSWKKLWEKLPSEIKGAQRFELERHAQILDLLTAAKISHREPIYARTVVHFVAVQGVAASRSPVWVKSLYDPLGRNEQTTDLIRLMPKLAKYARAQTILEDKLVRINKATSGSSSGGGGGGFYYGGTGSNKKRNRRPKSKKNKDKSGSSSSSSSGGGGGGGDGAEQKRGGDAKSNSSAARKA